MQPRPQAVSVVSGIGLVEAGGGGPRAVRTEYDMDGIRDWDSGAFECFDDCAVCTSPSHSCSSSFLTHRCAES